jgi:hypothetical protein
VGARFFAHVQTGPGAHPASCTMGTGSFPGVKRPGRGADHPPLLAPMLKMSRAISLLPSRPLVTCYRVTFTFTTSNVRGQAMPLGILSYFWTRTWLLRQKNCTCGSRHCWMCEHRPVGYSESGYVKARRIWENNRERRCEGARFV